MALVERIDKPFTKIEELEFQSDNKLLQLFEIQYNKISEMSKFNDKYQSIGKGTNKIIEIIANSEKTKKAFEVIQALATVSIIGYAVINNVGITDALGNVVSVIPGIGETLGNVITTPGGNGIITQLLADSSFTTVITKGLEEISNKKEMIKSFIIDKLPEKVKEKYFERENEKAEKRMQLENEYPVDRETYESNRELYNQKTKELLKDIFSKDKETDKTKDTTEQMVESSTEEAKKDEKSNPWQLSQEQIQVQRRINEIKQSRENTKTIENSSKQYENIDF